jgi:methylmalonyl-CoA/ethylmalonyl-CoA epimerase
MQGVATGKIMQIAVTVSDLDRSVAFYRDLVGMAFLFNAGTMDLSAIRRSSGAARNARAGQSDLKWRDDSVSEVRSPRRDYARLADAGMPSLQPPQMIATMPDHDLWLAIVSDPDGNPVGLMSEVARTA